MDISRLVARLQRFVGMGEPFSADRVHSGMRHQPNPLRPGLTAIAAVLALSSTPGFAQNADEAPEAAAPMVVAPPPVVTPPSTATSQSVAPATPSAAPSAAATGTTAPAPLVFDEEPAPAPVARTHKVSAQAVAAAVKPAPAPRVEATPAPTPAPVVASSSAGEPPAPAPAVATQVPVDAQKSVTQTDSSGEILPIAGAGLAILALAGGALALGRRRRDVDAEQPALAARTEMAAREQGYAVPAAASATPVMARHSETDSFIADAPVTAVPAGFDLSRFGRHTRAAYQGPTANNPSHSLKRRLKRANFFDQRERQGLTATATMPGASPAPIREMARVAQGADHLTVRAPARPRPAFRPAYQS